MMACCRVNDTYPQHAIFSLSSCLVNSSVGQLYISNDPPQPCGTLASLRSSPVTKAMHVPEQVALFFIT